MSAHGEPDRQHSFRVPFFLMLLVVLALYMRVHGMNVWHYSSDDAMHVNIAKGAGISEVLKFSSYETHPPLGNIFRHFWLMVSDNPDFVRSEALLFGIALIPLYYCIGTLLAGRLTGVMAALLIAFSNGCIVQSFVVRDYTLCVFFLSLSFYYYLLWRMRGQGSALAIYAVLMALALLTHIMAAFAFACIFIGEILDQWRTKTPLPKQLRWILPNLLILMLGAYIALLLRPALHAMSSFTVQTGYHLGFDAALFYPLFMLQQSLPGPAGALGAFAVSGIAAALLAHLARQEKSSRFILAQMLICIGIGMALVVTNFYPYANTRHVLWSLPFVIPPVAWALALACRRIAPNHTVMAACIATACIALSYSETSRFSQTFEYTMPETVWQSLTAYLKTLDDTQVIVAGKADMLQLEPVSVNPYTVFDDNVFTGEVQAKIIPYYRTNIVFNPFGYNYHTPAMLLRALGDAHDRGLLKDSKQLMIMNALNHAPAITDLMLCPTLQKEIVPFPSSFAPDHVFTREELYKVPASVLIIPTQVFINDVLAPDGKARSCFTHTL